MRVSVRVVENPYDLINWDHEFHQTRLAVLVQGDERLVIVMNPGPAPQSVRPTVRNRPRAPQLVEYETGVKHDPPGAIELELAPGNIRALPLTSR